MNILDHIIENKKASLDLKKDWYNSAKLQASPFFGRECASLVKKLGGGLTTRIIAEFKRKSPSKGIINDKADITEVAGRYEHYGAAGISILTDEEYFGGSNEDLMKVRETTGIPLLRKDFMIDERQIVEARSIGADVILLIAACLSREQVKKMAAAAKNIGLEVLLEIHGEDELDHISENVDIVGVNNRDLKTFEVNIETSLRLIQKIPKDKPAISESGIYNVETIVTLKKAGFGGFLIGEAFMKEPDPGKAFGEFINQLNKAS